MPPGRVDALVLEGLGRADLMAGEASHAVLRMNGDRQALPELVDMHRAVFYTEAAPVACVVINPDGNHWTVPLGIQEKLLPAKLNTYIAQNLPGSGTAKHKRRAMEISNIP
jgi:hypothetical protein